MTIITIDSYNAGTILQLIQPYLQLKYLAKFARVCKVWYKPIKEKISNILNISPWRITIEYYDDGIKPKIHCAWVKMGVFADAQPEICEKCMDKRSDRSNIFAISKSGVGGEMAYKIAQEYPTCKVVINLFGTPCPSDIVRYEEKSVSKNNILYVTDIEIGSFPLNKKKLPMIDLSEYHILYRTGKNKGMKLYKVIRSDLDDSDNSDDSDNDIS